MSTYLRLAGANSDTSVLTIEQCGAGRTVGTNVNEIVDVSTSTAALQDGRRLAGR